MLKKQLKTTNNKNLKLPLVLVSVVVLLAICQIITANSLTTWGKKLQKIEQDTLVLEKENKKMQVEIDSLGSLTRLKEFAAKKGFNHEISVVSLSTNKPVALKH